ncbi:MAG: MBL fold metallo-hydrolase [Chloroflexi bacterium]|nr:MBL fold metallo-hydrolase [Chloroflexota bacterium]
MKPATSSLALVSDGAIKKDGGTVFGQIPKATWEQIAPPDRRNRIALGLNCLLIRNGQSCVLVDTGLGSKNPEQTKERFGLSRSSLLKNLRAMGLTSRDVSAVVLTHLHQDHSGGCTRLDRSGEAVPTFPNATYYIQRRSWEEATSPNERACEFYHPEDFLPLQERGLICLLDGNEEVAPGVRVRLTGGHCKGHQMVLVNHGGERVAFLGDLVPTYHHLNVGCIASTDTYPEDTLAIKKDLVAEAEGGGWLMVFCHGVETRAGYLEKRKGRINFRPVEFGGP